MQSRNVFPFDCTTAKRVFRSQRKPPVQRVDIDVEHEDLVEQIDKRGKFLDPPQKKVTASLWSATRALTLSTSQM